MRPYNNLRNEELAKHTDKSDGMYRKASATGNPRGGCKNKVNKAQARRNLKHQNKTAQERLDRKDGE